SANTRSEPDTAHGASPCVFTRAHAAQPTPEPTMPQSASAADAATRAAAEADATHQAAVTAAANDAAAQTAQRSADILDLCTRHGCVDKAAGWLRDGKPVEQVRALILDDMATRDQGAGGHLNRVQAGQDEADKRRTA